MTTNDVSDTRISDERLQNMLNAEIPLGMSVEDARSLISEVISRRTDHDMMANFVRPLIPEGQNPEQAESVFAWIGMLDHYRKLASRHPQPVNEPAEWQVEKAARAIHWEQYEDPAQAEHEWNHWAGSADYARKLARSALRAASIPAPERSKEEVITIDGMQATICEALLDAFPMADKVADNYAAVAAKAVAANARLRRPLVAWACLTCNSSRSVDPCPKCGTALTKPADGWVWPGLPDIGRIRELAREVGYAIGVHGSLERDLDLIAAPWVADAVEPMELAEHIAYGLGGNVVDFERQDKPCGRWSCNIHTPDWTKMIDLSVMPPVPVPVTITDEMVERFMEGWNDSHPEMSHDMRPSVKAGLTAALSKPGEQG